MSTVIIRQCSGSSSVLARCTRPQIRPRVKLPSCHVRTGAAAASYASSVPSGNLDTQVPHSFSSPQYDARTTQDFESHKKTLLASMDMLRQIQDAPSEKEIASDDHVATYWAHRMENAIADLENEKTRLRIAVVGESSGQNSILDLILPYEQGSRRSALETGKVHRIRYGSSYSLTENESNSQENLEQIPVSWLKGISSYDGGEIVEVPGLDLDLLSMDDIVHSSDLVLLRTDSTRQLLLEQEQNFLSRYRHKGQIVIVADMLLSPDLSSTTATTGVIVTYLKANLARAVKSSPNGYSNATEDSRVNKILRCANPEPLPPILMIPSRHHTSLVSSGHLHQETVRTLQKLVASTLLSDEYAQTQHRQQALVTRCHDLMIAGIENMEMRLKNRLDTFGQVDRLSERIAKEIQRVEKDEQMRIEQQVTTGDIDKDVQGMRRVLDQFFKVEVPTWMLFARSGEIAERMHEIWAVGAFSNTEHRMAYILGRLHQSSQAAFRATLQDIENLIKDLEERSPLGSSIVLRDLTLARQLLYQSMETMQQDATGKDASVVSNLFWKHRSSYGPVDSSSLVSASTGALERLQRRGQVVLAQGLGLEGTALFASVGLAQQYPPEIYLTSGTLLSLAGLGYMHARWNAAENEFRAQAEALAVKLKSDVVATYKDQIGKTLVRPLSNVVNTLDKNLGTLLHRSMEQRAALSTIKQSVRGKDDIKL
ncbi:hypothetical protein BGZ94_008707 [Podila epigama]|nr:hypothetical protein BGZ94_008707 [Podila epigama]